MPRKLKYIDQELLIPLVKEGLSIKAIAKHFNTTPKIISRCFKKYNIEGNFDVKTLNGRKNLGKLKQKWLKDNPNKHIWKNKDKFKSPPCEKFKEWLKTQNIEFIEEFQPMLEDGRYYSIDIAFPNKKIGIEINGNMHYNNDGTLKEYYQIRNDLIESKGWKLYQIHYSLCYSLKRLEYILPVIINSENKQIFDYDSYIKNKIIKYLAKKSKLKRAPHPYKKITITEFITTISTSYTIRQVLQKLNLPLDTTGYKVINKILKNNQNIRLLKKQFFNKKRNPNPDPNWRTAPKINRRKVIRPSYEELIKDTEKSGFRATGRKYNVSDNCVRKWIKSYKKFMVPPTEVESVT